MKKSTKQVILMKARELFNQYGYNGVSMKDIADAAGISKGNLTYHFKKKENIIEALIPLSEKREERPVPESLEQLDSEFRHIQEVVTDNSFYFMHHAQLSQVSLELSRKQSEVYRETVKQFQRAFDNLQKAGLLRSELIDGEFDTIIDTLHMGSIYWDVFSRIQESKLEYRQYAWKLMYGLLTDKGKEQLKTL